MYKETIEFLKSIGAKGLLEENGILYIADINLKYYEEICEYCKKKNLLFYAERDDPFYIDPVTGKLKERSYQTRYWIEPLDKNL